jgi:hypothetical protein
VRPPNPAPLPLIARLLGRPLLLLLLLLCASPAFAQGKAQDIVITVISTGEGADKVGIAYNRKLSEAEIRQDIATIASNLKISPPPAKIESGGGIPMVEFDLAGLADWRTGAINLDPLIQAYKRYGRFQVLFMFLGSFPMPVAENVDRPPLRVEMQVGGNVVSYRVSIDQSAGVPTNLPSAQPQKDSPWKLIGLLAIAIVVAVSVFLILQVIMGQRRASANPAVIAPDQRDGSAAAAGRAPEGKP